jgi:acyl dehydratase
VSPTTVNEASIRNWCLALGDALPVYTDAEFASATRWGGIVAPPTMLQVWTMPDRREAPRPIGAESELMALLMSRGYLGVVATNCEQDYRRLLKPGDRVSSHTTITGIAGPKQTAIGEGYFLTTETEFRDESGEPVGTVLFRALRYRAGERRSTPQLRVPELPASPTVVVGRSAGSATTETRRLGDVAVGDELPSLEIAVTPTLIVAGAIASGDFTVLHHDRDRAVAAGAPDIFMNIHATNGLVGRFVTEWAGPEAFVERVAIRLGVSNYPYDTFRLEGRVTARERSRVAIEIRGTNSLGDALTGSAEVRLA